MSGGSVVDAAVVLGELALEDQEFGSRTTYRVGGRARLLADVNSTEDVLRVSAAVRQSGVEVFVLGVGSNLLVADAGFDGLVVTLGSGFASIEISGLEVLAGSSVLLPVLARQTVGAGL
ncbi:MAG: FAD-binding protein, partial [Acidimicrobiales bacterium]